MSDPGTIPGLEEPPTGKYGEEATTSRSGEETMTILEPKAEEGPVVTSSRDGEEDGESGIHAGVHPIFGGF